MTCGAGETTEDFFLGGRVRAVQPRHGYRAATDPVFLAAAVPARQGEAVLELGCGVGVASLCLAARVPGLTLCGVELQPDYAELARRNARANGVALTVSVGDIADLPAELRGQSFDHVMANPPYFAPGAGPSAQDSGRETALRENTPLVQWVDVALRRLRPGGWLTLIHLAERLPAILGAMEGRTGGVVVLPMTPRAGRPAGRVIVQGRKGARAPFRLLAPLVVHEGAAHDGDRDSFTMAAQAVLREGAALELARRQG